MQEQERGQAGTELYTGGQLVKNQPLVDGCRRLELMLAGSLVG